MKEASEFPDAHLRVFARRTVSADDDVRSVYFVGICGTGMGSLAGLFRQAGFEVSGSDANAYPPMSDTLRQAGITIHEGYNAAHLDSRPDLIVVGNACTPTHPEAARAREESLPQLSFPEAFAEFFIGQRRSLVVAGTHGKTTTSALLGHTATSAGLDPTYLVGGVVLNGGSSCRVGSGDITIVEGDEYDTAYFDKRPKFMLYRPTAAIVTSLEFDHADIYDDWDDYRTAFERFVALVPDSGYLVLNNDVPAVTDLARFASAQVLRYGLLREAPSGDGASGDGGASRGNGARNDPWKKPDVTADNIVVDESGISFDLILPNEAPAPTTLPVTGRHNLSNALAVAALAWSQGISTGDIVSAFRSFKGIKRRQEVIGTINDVIVIDDFAHHPTAASVTIAGVRERWKTRRLVAVFEPRSNSSRRKVFEQPYVEAFAQADVALFARPPFRHNDSVDDFMDVERICDALRDQGVEAMAASDQEALRARLKASIRPGDVVLIMSNGGFGGLHKWLLGELSSRNSVRHDRHDGDAELLARATDICHRTLLIDTHIDLPHRLTHGVKEDVSVRTDTGDFDFVRARAGGLDAAFMAAYVPPELQDTGTSFTYAEVLIDTVERLIAEHPDCFGRAVSASDVERNRAAGLVSLPVAIENGAALEEDITNLHHFAGRGVQYITLTHGRSNALCDSSYDENRQWGGLSPFGSQVVAAMNELRMMIDVSHVSDDAFYQILEASSQPVIATHSAMRHFTPGWERNMSDDMARALAEQDGVLMIAFGSSFLSNELRARSSDARQKREQAVAARGLDPESDDAKRLEASMRAENPLGSVEQVADHVIHAVSLMGIDAVGIGSDFDGVYSLPSGLQDVAAYPNLVAALLRRGLTENELEKLLGGNMLAFWRRIQGVTGA